jgi:8-oxo-dGTP pyrophosphatase MutT (NUDIX family)
MTSPISPDEIHKIISTKPFVVCTEGMRPEDCDNKVIDKAGLLMFHEDKSGSLLMLLTKPHAREDTEYATAPLFQIPKGTRKYRLPDSHLWLDIGSGSEKCPDNAITELLHVTAVREAFEEAGASPHSIKCLFSIGVKYFNSATTGDEKSMALFAAETTSTHLLSPVDKTTDEIMWCSISKARQMAEDGLLRPNHFKMAEEAIKSIEESAQIAREMRLGQD